MWISDLGLLNLSKDAMFDRFVVQTYIHLDGTNTYRLQKLF